MANRRMRNGGLSPDGQGTYFGVRDREDDQPADDSRSYLHLGGNNGCKALTNKQACLCSSNFHFLRLSAIAGPGAFHAG